MASPSMTISATSSPRSPESHTPTSGGIISLSSPITSSGKKPWENKNSSKAGRMLEDDDHSFRAPCEGESRSPCPALNTLANHGYLPRSGHKITRKDLLAALQNPETYNLSDPLARLLVYGGLFMMHDTIEKHSISLHELARHGRIEHSASVVHKDTPAGNKFAPSRCDTVLLDGLLVGESLTLEEVARRRVELERISPLDIVHQEVARGEWALVLDIFGRENGGEIPSDFLRVWLKKNRFPEEWRPKHEQGLFDTASKASDIRHAMDEYRKHYDESPEECMVEPTIFEALKSTSPTKS